MIRLKTDCSFPLGLSAGSLATTQSNSSVRAAIASRNWSLPQLSGELLPLGRSGISRLIVPRELPIRHWSFGLAVRQLTKTVRKKKSVQKMDFGHKCQKRLIN